jgi:hypothetical protein
MLRWASGNTIDRQFQISAHDPESGFGQSSAPDGLVKTVSRQIVVFT